MYKKILGNFSSKKLTSLGLNLHSQEHIYPTSDLCNAISSESIKMGRSGSNVTSVHDCISYLNNICVQMLVLWSSV